MPLFSQPPVVRLSISAPGGEAPRGHPKQPHPPSVVAQVKHLVETTRLPHKIIAERTGVDKGTVSRWSEKHGWTRPPGAWPRQPRPERRYVPNVIGRALAQRLRMQAERLVAEIEGAERVDPAALAEAISLLERARAEQRIRRARKLVPPCGPSPAARTAPALDALTRQHISETRRAAARKAWATRWANQAAPPKWMRQGSAEEAAYRKARRERKRDRDLPSPHLPHVERPPRTPWPWDRRAAALKGWKTRYARMRESGLTEKKHD